MKWDHVTGHAWWSLWAPQFAQWLKTTSLREWNFFDEDKIKAVRHVSVTLCRLPTFLVMVITASSTRPQTLWSKSDVPGWPLVPWPSPTSRTTGTKSATYSIHKAGPRKGRRARLQFGSMGHEKGHAEPSRPRSFVRAADNSCNGIVHCVESETGRDVRP